MKKIIALFVMLLAFSAGMNAQEKYEAAAKKDVELLKKHIQLDEKTENAVFYLFVKKHDNLSAQNLTAENKKDVNRIIEAKLRATFSDEQIRTLEKDPTVFNQLIGVTPTK